MRQIQATSDVLVRKNVLERVSYVPGGCSLNVADLVVGNVVPEATPLTAPTDGKRTVCKQAAILDGSTVTVFRVETKAHQFAVGDVIFQAVGGAAYAITAISVAAGTVGGVDYDTLTVGTALEAATEGTFIYESDAAGEDAGALENDADAILKEAFEAPTAADVVIVKGDALLHAVIVEGCVGPLYLAQLKGVIEAKY